MKTNQILSVVALAATLASAQTTVYGPSGLNFVPSAFASGEGRWSGSAGGSTDQSPLGLIALQGDFLEGRLELGLANAWRLVEGDSVGWNPGLFPMPIVPSAKWIIDREERGRQSWGYAAGFSMPLGAWAAAGWRLRLPLASPQIHAGLGTPLNSIQAFGGLALELCDLEGRTLPVTLAVDGALAGSTGTLGQAEEAYWSAGVTTRLGRNLSFQAVHRRDRHYQTTSDDGNRDGGISLLRVLWNFGGNAQGASR